MFWNKGAKVVPILLNCIAKKYIWFLTLYVLLISKISHANLKLLWYFKLTNTWNLQKIWTIAFTNQICMELTPRQHILHRDLTNKYPRVHVIGIDKTIVLSVKI